METRDRTTDRAWGQLAVVVAMAMLGGYGTAKLVEARAAHLMRFETELDDTPALAPLLVLVGDSHLANFPETIPGAPRILEDLELLLPERDPRLDGLRFTELSAPALTAVEALVASSRLLNRGGDVKVAILALRPGLVGARRVKARAAVESRLKDDPPHRDASYLKASLGASRDLPPGLTSLVERQVDAHVAARPTFEAPEGRLAKLVRGSIPALAFGEVPEGLALRLIVALGGADPRDEGMEPEAAQVDLGALRALIRLYRAQGAAVLCYQPPEDPLDRGARIADREVVAGWLRRMAAEEGCPLLELVHELPSGDEYWSGHDAVHFRPAGHRRIAERLAAWGAEQGLWAGAGGEKAGEDTGGNAGEDGGEAGGRE